VGETTGTFEVLVLASVALLRNALKGLQTVPLLDTTFIQLGCLSTLFSGQVHPYLLELIEIPKTR